MDPAVNNRRIDRLIERLEEAIVWPDVNPVPERTAEHVRLTLIQVIEDTTAYKEELDGTELRSR